MNGFANIESAALQAMDDASDYFEALCDLLHSPAYDPFEDCFFGEVCSDHHEEFTAKLKAANGVHGDLRKGAMAAVAEWLVVHAEKRREHEARAELNTRG